MGAGLACLALTACGGGDPAPAPENATVQASADDGKAECAIGQDAAWARTCLIERGDSAEGKTLTVRHPDGGFRRFRIVDDGRGIVPADGSEQATLSMSGDKQIEVAVGQDRYRLPATFAAPKT